MVDQSLSELLMKLGVDDKAALKLQNNINGSDLTNLVNALKLPNSQQAVAQANEILSRYGINIKEARMNNDRLYRMYKGVSEEVIEMEDPIENMTPISESDRAEDHILALEGFNYLTTLDTQLAEQLMDWLESNKVEFLTNGEGHFHIKCEDRDHAYKVGRTISGLMRKQRLVRDSNNTEGAMAERNDFKKRANQAKDKITKLKPRDPHALAASLMQAKSGGPMNAQHKVDQKDIFNRKAKHKTREYGEKIELEAKDNVLVNGREAIITIPKGPQGLVGVLMDGQLVMVNRDDIQRIDEGVLGFTKIDPLFRLRELAGLPPAPQHSPGDVSMPDDNVAVFTDKVSDPGDDMPGGVPGDIDPLAQSPEDLGNPDDLGDPDDLAGLSSIEPVADPSVDPMPSVDVVGTQSEPSPAMTAIDDHLNNVQLSLPDVKISEYKMVLHKLQDLANQLQSMGKDYLGERRRLKEDLGSDTKMTLLKHGWIGSEGRTKGPSESFGHAKARGHGITVHDSGNWKHYNGDGREQGNGIGASSLDSHLNKWSL